MRDASDEAAAGGVWLRRRVPPEWHGNHWAVPRIFPTPRLK